MTATWSAKDLPWLFDALKLALKLLDGDAIVATASHTLPIVGGSAGANEQVKQSWNVDAGVVAIAVGLVLDAGLGSLSQDSTLSTIARGHAADMIKRKFFDHVNPSGEDPRARARAGGYSGWVRENIAYTIYSLPGSVLVEMADKDLMNSPGHRKNILDDTGQSVGIGIVYDAKGGISVCQLFSP